jgi:hypothetical protein
MTYPGREGQYTWIRKEVRMTKHETTPDRIGLMAATGAAGPGGPSTEELMLYGQFVGDWEFSNEYQREGGRVESSMGEWHFAWALEGRAVVDLWTYPPRAERERTGVGAGGLLRWVFSDIGPFSFTWRAESSPDEGKTWKLTQTMRARRIP